MLKINIILTKTMRLCRSHANSVNANSNSACKVEMQQTFWWSSWLLLLCFLWLCYFHINLLPNTFTVVVTNTTVWTVIAGRLVTHHTMSTFIFSM